MNILEKYFFLNYIKHDCKFGLQMKSCRLKFKRNYVFVLDMMYSNLRENKNERESVVCLISIFNVAITIFHS